MKKLLSIILIAVILLSTMAPTAQAASLPANKIVDTFVKTDISGNEMNFDLVKNPDGDYTLNYYLNGVLTTTYDISAVSTTVVAHNVTGNTKNYTLDASALSVQQIPAVRGPDRWQHAGYIQYRYSERFDCDPIAVVLWKDTDAFSGTYVVNTYQNSVYSDWVAVITSVLIGAGMSLLAPATLAAGILAGMIGYYGSEVINGLISIPFIEEYECSYVTYTMRAEVIGAGMNTSSVDYEGGVEYRLNYVDAPAEYHCDGWTPRTWACRAFAEEVWDDSVAWWPPFPGVVDYPYYI